MHSDLCHVRDSSLWYTCEWTKEWSKPGVSPKARMDISESGRSPACNACYISIIICKHIEAASKTVGTRPHTGFAFAPRIASDDQGEALERCEGQMRHIQPQLFPQPCQPQAHLDNDRTVPNPCFLSPQTVHIRVRIFNLFHRALLWHFIAYHHAKKTPIHLLAAGLTMSIRSLPSR